MTAVLAMKEVTKVYGTGEAAVRALDNVDFEANGGEVTVVMGPSGAGKTTFLTIAGALLQPTSGSVHISGVELDKARRETAPRCAAQTHRIRLPELQPARIADRAGERRRCDERRSLEGSRGEGPLT